MERVSENLPIPENETSALLTQSTFAVSVQKVDPMTFTGLSISAVIESFDDQRIDQLMVNMMMSNERSTGSLSLPSNLLQKANGSRVTMSVFTTNSLFLRRDTNNMKVASIVISAGVVGVQRVRNLDPPIMAVFQRNPVSWYSVFDKNIELNLLRRMLMVLNQFVHSGIKLLMVSCIHMT